MKTVKNKREGEILAKPRRKNRSGGVSNTAVKLAKVKSAVI